MKESDDVHLNLQLVTGHPRATFRIFLTLYMYLSSQDRLIQAENIEQSSQNLF